MSKNIFLKKLLIKKLSNLSDKLGSEKILAKNYFFQKIKNSFYSSPPISWKFSKKIQRGGGYVKKFSKKFFKGKSLIKRDFWMVRFWTLKLLKKFQIFPTNRKSKFEKKIQKIFQKKIFPKMTKMAFYYWFLISWNFFLKSFFSNFYFSKKCFITIFKSKNYFFSKKLKKFLPNLFFKKISSEFGNP